jgi:ubiquinone/menaquinone biosynthesis C-methylase UbiE
MSIDQKRAWDRKYDSQGILWARTHDDWFEVGEDDLVLDVGSGSGKSIRSLRGEVIAVDFSRNALSLAKDILHDCSLICGDVRALPFSDSAFDFVRVSFVIDHLRAVEHTRTMDEIIRVLKAGGFLAFECFSKSDARFTLRDVDQHGDYFDGDGILHHNFDQREIEKLLSSLSIRELEETAWEQQVGPGKAMRRSAFRVLAQK